MPQPDQLDLNGIIEEPLNKIWNDFSHFPFSSIPPLYVSNVPKDAIVFVGINPSLSDQERKRLEAKGVRKAESYRHESEKEKNNKYFYKFIDMAEAMDEAWGHIDLLYIRETNQKNIESLVTGENGLKFIWEQLMISKRVIDAIITHARPKAFVVANTLSRRFLGLQKQENVNEWMNLDFSWSDNIGTYYHRSVPFFFSSMLTGQRALDNESYRRLAWHLNKVVKGKMV